MTTSRPTRPVPPLALTIAGSDPSGGAGLQADLKTFAALGVYGFSVLTMVVAQSSSRVLRSTVLEPSIITDQIRAVADQAVPGAVKIGALGDAGVVSAVDRAIDDYRLPRPVIDPVMLSSSGARLLSAEAEPLLRERLFSKAALVTPNLMEAQALSGILIDSPFAMREAARIIARMGAAAVLIKGGHLADRYPAIDLLFDGAGYLEFSATRLVGADAHGTGCAYSAAIAAYIARGEGMAQAVRKAKAFVTRAIRLRMTIGNGRPVLDHFAAGKNKRPGERTSHSVS